MLDNVNGLVSILIIFVVLYAVGRLINFILKKVFSNAKFDTANDYKILIPNLDIDEISENENTLPEKILNPESDTGDVVAAKRMIILEDGLTIREKNQFEFDPDNEVTVLIRNSKSLIFKRNEIFAWDDYKIGNKVGELSDPPLGVIRLVLPINDRLILIAGDPASSPYPDTHLWQVSVDTFEQKQIAKQVYFTHKRPTKIFVSDKNNHLGNSQEIALIYYTGEERFFSYGGGATKPKRSIVRVYNDQYPNGQDMAEFNYKAGTIVDVKWQSDEIVLISDPSPPKMASNKPKLPVRVWKLKR